MKKFVQILVFIQTIGGVFYFAAVFASPLAIAEKVIAGILLVFISSGIFLALVGYVALAHGYRLLIEQLCRGIESRQVASSVLDTPSLLDYIQTELTGGLRLGRTANMGYLLLGMFFVWIVGGWLLSRFVS